MAAGWKDQGDCFNRAINDALGDILIRPEHRAPAGAPPKPLTVQLLSQAFAIVNARQKDWEALERVRDAEHVEVKASPWVPDAETIYVLDMRHETLLELTRAEPKVMVLCREESLVQVQELVADIRRPLEPRPV